MSLRLRPNFERTYPRKYFMEFDAIVIGAGHAGIEAARSLSASFQFSPHRTALITMDATKIGAMSCNPAIGGVAKSHLVAEVDAMGGVMGYAADMAAVQARRLNMNKGPAVRSTRLQCDKDFYVRTVISEVRTMKGITVLQGEAQTLRVRGGVWEVRLNEEWLKARAVIVTTGTFMRGLMFCGDVRKEGGRIGDEASKTLSMSLAEVGHKLTRLKTGTPARLKAESINLKILEQQWGDPELRRFSWKKPKDKLPQLCCYITHTSEKTHDIIRANFHKSPLFAGEIVGTGPRYCPSIEDKVKRFADRSRHQIFLEPEGLNTNSIYPNGMSTSLPADVQMEFLKSITGLEQVEVLKFGYAVEYDSVNPTELSPGLMSKFAPGLFLAGQVNRTSGYEEAAAQGLWAGINAGLFLKNKEHVVPDRSRSYLETLVDDLTTKGTEEPYRLFTSRSEYRLVLREDNAAERLYDLADSLGILTEEQKISYQRSMADISLARITLENVRIRVSPDKVISSMEYLRRPEITWEDLTGLVSVSDRAIERLEVEAKYLGYLPRQVGEIAALKKLSSWVLDPEFNIDSLSSIPNEVIDKFRLHKPKNVLELTKISGISPTAIIMIANAAGSPPPDTSNAVDCFT